MDNDIYNKIADYNDYVHLQQPAGISDEMLQAFKKKQIKLLIEVLMWIGCGGVIPKTEIAGSVQSIHK